MKAFKMILQIFIIIVSILIQLANILVGFVFFGYIAIKAISFWQFFIETNTVFEVIITLIFSLMIASLALFASHKVGKAFRDVFRIRSIDNQWKAAVRHFRISIVYFFAITFIFILSYAVIMGWIPSEVQNYFGVYQIFVAFFAAYKITSAFDKLNKNVI